jgi:hypothetical protein
MTTVTLPPVGTPTLPGGGMVAKSIGTYDVLQAAGISVNQ